MRSQRWPDPDRCDDKNHIEWQAESGYTTEQLQRVAHSSSGRGYAGGINALASRDCGLTDPYAFDAVVPAPGGRVAWSPAWPKASGAATERTVQGATGQRQSVSVTAVAKVLPRSSWPPVLPAKRQLVDVFCPDTAPAPAAPSCEKRPRIPGSTIEPVRSCAPNEGAKVRRRPGSARNTSIGRLRSAPALAATPPTAPRQGGPPRARAAATSTRFPYRASEGPRPRCRRLATEPINATRRRRWSRRRHASRQAFNSAFGARHANPNRACRDRDPRGDAEAAEGECPRGVEKGCDLLDDLAKRAT